MVFRKVNLEPPLNSVLDYHQFPNDTIPAIHGDTKLGIYSFGDVRNVYLPSVNNQLCDGLGVLAVCLARMIIVQFLALLDVIWIKQYMLDVTPGPVMPRGFGTYHYVALCSLSCQAFCPRVKLFKALSAIGESKHLAEFQSPPVKCSGVVRFAANIHSDNKCFCCDLI